MSLANSSGLFSTSMTPWYCRANENSMFEIEKPIATIGIGVDQIPSEIRNSSVLSGNDLGLLGSIETFPTIEEINEYNAPEGEKHQVAKELLAKGEIMNAWKILLK